MPRLRVNLGGGRLIRLPPLHPPSEQHTQEPKTKSTNNSRALRPRRVKSRHKQPKTRLDKTRKTAFFVDAKSNYSSSGDGRPYTRVIAKISTPRSCIDRTPCTGMGPKCAKEPTTFKATIEKAPTSTQGIPAKSAISQTGPFPSLAYRDKGQALHADFNTTVTQKDEAQSIAQHFSARRTKGKDRARLLTLGDRARQRMSQNELRERCYRHQAR